MNYTPVAVFTYNRPEHTHQMLASLAGCSRLDECRVVIFSDAARVAEHADSVEKTRRVVHDWSKRYQARVIERSENWGLARSVVDGVTNLCDEFGRVIVLEDDMVVSSRFLDYMITALDRYGNDERVCQISGYMFPVKHPSNPDAFFLPLTTTWGWATWQRAWELFQWDISGALLDLQEQAVRRAFDLDGAYPYSRMLEDCIAGRNDSWGIRWWWSMFKANKIVLHPRHSFVWVGGFDGTGIHGGVNRNMMFIPSSDTIDFSWGAHFAFPSDNNINWPALERIKDYLRKNSLPVQAPRPVYQRLTAKLTKFLKGRLKMLNSKVRKWALWLDEQIVQARIASSKNLITIAPTAELGPEAIIDNVYRRKDCITIGEHSYVRGRLLTYGHGGQIKIGEWCYVGVRTEIWSMDSITIGNRVLIAHDVNIHDGTAHSKDLKERHEHYRHITERGHPVTLEDLPGVSSAPIVIEDDVWISFGVTIMKGVRIGRGSIIAANSIVAKDVPENTMYRNKIEPIITPLRD